MPTTPPSVPAVYTLPPDQLILTLHKASWTQEQIANETGVSQATICRIYHGKHHDPRYSIVKKLQELVLRLDEFKVAA